MALCLDGWVSHKGLANIFHLQFGMLWAQARSTGPQIGPLAFNRLCTTFYAPILSPPSIHHPHHYHMWCHYPHKKSCSKQLEFRVFESYSPTKLWLMNRQVLAVNSFFQHNSPGSYNTIITWTLAMSLNVALCVEAGFCQIQSHMFRSCIKTSN